MSETSGSGKKKALGVVGILITIASVFWFALRPRLKGQKNTEN